MTQDRTSALTATCSQLHSMLARLVEATDTYARNLHWSSDGAYSKFIDEKPWRDVQQLAVEMLGALSSEALSPAELSSLDVQRDTLMRVLKRLVESNASYWSAMKDGYRGRSFEDARQVPQWEAARAEGRRVLAMG